jgi:putative transposase
VGELVERGVSERMACRVVGLSRSSYRYRSQCDEQQQSPGLREELVALAQKHRRYGYRRITALLRREGKLVNHKRVFRLWQEQGLSLPRKRPRKRRTGEKAPLPLQARYRGQVWTYDFVFDRTENRAVLKMLVVLDEYTRECHCIRVGRRLGSEAVIGQLEQLFGQQGAPEHLRSDNGGEFIATKLRQWLESSGTQTVYIEPGHPWENGYAESFIGKLRDECLNEEVFWSEKHAQVVMEHWRREYNERRPHSALGYQTPAEMALESLPVGRDSSEAYRL